MSNCILKDFLHKQVFPKNYLYMTLSSLRIQKETVDPMKLQAELSDLSNSSCDLKRSLEMVSLIEAQLKDMTPNLDSIAEYCFCYI